MAVSRHFYFHHNMPLGLASLADLPNELLVDIFEHPTFPPDALYFLALLSRRLHFIALPIYFARNGIDLESKSVTIELETDRLDPLSALKICLFMSSMDHISCVFPHPGCYYIVPVLAQMKRLETFISRLSCVKKVTLYLDPRHPHARRCLSTQRCPSATTDKALKDWVYQYGSLLNCIVDRRCESLTVVNGDQVIEAYELQPPGFSEKYLPSVASRLFPSQNPRMLGFRRDPTQGTVDIRLSPVPSSGLSTLTSLQIHSPTLLVPPGLNWTLSALRHSSIASLTICMSSPAVDARYWSTILPLIASAARNLTAVALKEVDLQNEPDALDFLRRLPQLTNLDVAHMSPLYDAGTHEAAGISCPFKRPFKRLLDVRAPPTVIDHLLSHAGSCPSIRAICVVLYDPAFHELTRHIASIIRRLGRRGLSPRIGLSIHCPRIADTVRSMMWQGASAAAACFGRVDTVHLEGSYNPFGLAVVDTIVQFVALFPSVKHVSFTTGGSFSETDALDLVRSVRATDFLRTLEFDGVSYDLPTLPGNCMVRK